jgi:hypothetical protein
VSREARGVLAPEEFVQLGRGVWPPEQFVREPGHFVREAGIYPHSEITVMPVRAAHGGGHGPPPAPTHARTHLSTARRPAVVLANGRDVMNGVGPTPVLHTQSPKGIKVPSWAGIGAGEGTRARGREERSQA